MSHYLVTGGAGFIGSNIVEKLLKEGETVTVLDNFSTGKHENLQFSAPVRIIEGDIRALEVCIKACRSADYVLHQAALGSVPRSIEDPLTTHAVNATGTLNMLIAAQRNNVRRFIFASSSSVYGDQSPAHAETDNAISAKVETMTPHPRSPYAVSKLAGEYYCKVFSQCFGLETISLRYFNVFGKRQDPFSQYAAVVPLFFKALLHDKPPRIFGDGNQSRDFTFIANVVEANRLACRAYPEASGRVFNIACGEQSSINNLFERISTIINKRIKPVYDEPRQGDVRHSLADITLARNVLGYNAVFSFEQGLEETARWYKEL